MNIHVLSHADSDGRAASYAAFRNFRGQAMASRTKFYEVQYNQPFPIDLDTLTKDDHVYILDFSYDRVTLDRVYEKVGKLVIIDHHESALEQLRDRPYAIFDMNKSGAMLAWEYFFPNISPPMPFLFVDDFDMWRWKFTNHTAAFEAWLRYDRVGQDWDKWEKLCFDREALDNALVKGAVIVDINEGIIKRFIDNPDSIMINNFFYDESCRKVVYAIYNDISILHSELAQAVYTKFEVDMTIGWRVKGKNVVFSIRSPDKERFSAKRFAEHYNGGGHPSAAGFSLPLDKGMELVKHFMSKT
jgi:oligoribonuclease NrnB/cAMP/cGMP phosphodiesterase (DHH superfamily)